MEENTQCGNAGHEERSTVWECVYSLKSVVISPGGGSMPAVRIGSMGVCMWWGFECTPWTVHAGEYPVLTVAALGLAGLQNL